MCYIWIIRFSILELAKPLCVGIVIRIMKLYNIFSAPANKLFHHGQKLYFAKNIKLIALCPQIAILNYWSTDDRYFITQNLLVLIFKFYVFKSIVNAKLSFENLENGIGLRNWRKLDVYKKKWSFIENSLQSE